MKTPLIDVWMVHTNNDEMRNGPPTHFFSTQKKAYEVAKGGGYYAGDAPITKGQAIQVGDKIYLIDCEIDIDGIKADKKKKLREQALAKLTEEEINALMSKP